MGLRDKSSRTDVAPALYIAYSIDIRECGVCSVLYLDGRSLSSRGIRYSYIEDCQL